MSMGKFIPVFNASQILGDLKKHDKEVLEKAVEIFKYSGEGFVNNSRNLRTYKDRTGNLRSSIGYMILVNRKRVQESFPGDKAVGKAEGRKEAARLTGTDKGIVIVGVAGMEYGRDVEARGYDVITGPGEQAQLVISELVGRL